jgi:hypothetical protein
MAHRSDIILVAFLALVVISAETLAVRFFVSGSGGFPAGLILAATAGIALAWMLSVIYHRL